jgi:hypothetical protein
VTSVMPVESLSNVALCWSHRGCISNIILLSRLLDGVTPGKIMSNDNWTVELWGAILGIMAMETNTHFTKIGVTVLPLGEKPKKLGPVI